MTSKINSDKKSPSSSSVNTAEYSAIPEAVQLKKELGVIDGIGVIVGVIIGSGIFVSPKGVLLNAGSVLMSLVVWMLCGLLSTFGACCYAELGAAIPKSGGEFAYLNESFGPLLAFLYLWVALLIIMPTGNAIIALTFAEYILQPFYGTCQAPHMAVKLLAVVVILFLTFVNCYSMKWVTRIQDSFAFAKIVALLIIIGAGMYHLIFGNTENLQNVTEDTSWNFSNIALAFYSGMFSFSGWNALNFVTEEMKNPVRDLPRAIIISIPLVSLIYLMTNVAYFSVLTKDEILSSSATAGSFGDKVLGVMSWIMPLCVALSTFGGLNGGIFSSSRLFFVGAREGHLPRIVSMINVQHSTPTPSLIFLAIMTIFYLWVGGIYVLINFTSFIEALFITLTISALLYLRIRAPKMDRPIKVSLFFPICFLLIGILLVILPFFQDFFETGIALAITLSGIPVYVVFVMWKNKPRWMVAFSDWCTDFTQKFLLCAPTDAEGSIEDITNVDYFSDDSGKANKSL
ncbi:Y+L amino acid transporter 2-like [Argiope bruennichi]|uniref:Y+L amino acid transporter 2 like protein n=1 Tax=Argiope bruennichi TaxID=94029 RepID=A0A8T0F9C6_ARGBR|nr:Y+L amino acid transporter 2-like [Argiope bruennichi]KAF8786972.1 Y+L amino acid transporter 2 like protein [Argiope bruennichi]